MENSRILIVEEDDAHRAMLGTILRVWGFTVTEARDGDEAVALVHGKPFDIVLTDVRMARMDGISALEYMLEYNPALPIILMTAYSSVATAVDALRLGAYDYLVKPLDFDLLKNTLKETIEKSRHSIKNREDKSPIFNSFAKNHILGESRAVKNMLQHIATVAPTEAPVLISGEAGAGKKLVAHSLHAASRRASKPVITINCAAATESILESRFFNLKKISFGKVDRNHARGFEQSSGYTLLLDEIGELPFPLQTKLSGILDRIGVNHIEPEPSGYMDVRIIATTKRNLQEETRQKQFRDDLYFRLNVISIEVPPLRMRGDDIPLLAANFLRRSAGRNHKKIKGFAPQALDCLKHYTWPGNVRELENAVERAVILCGGDLICEADLPACVAQAPEPASIREGATFYPLEGLSLDMVEKGVIENTLQLTKDNKSEAARRLGITRATLHNKLKKYGLE